MASDKYWERYTGQMFEGKPSGNALHAQECRDTPLEAKAILDLVVSNLAYYGDVYYRPITDPVDLRVDEFYKAIGEEAPQ